MITDQFLLRTGIIQSEDQIVRQGYVLTPGLTNLHLRFNNKQVGITVDPGTLKVESKNDFELPFEIGEKYCASLPHIVGRAYGMNFNYSMNARNIDELFDDFSKIDFHNTTLRKLTYQFDAEGAKVTVVLENAAPKMLANFNFHYENNDVISRIGHLRKRCDSNQKVAYEFMDEIFK